MIQRFDIEQRIREWGLREDVVEKDHALGWLLWAIGSDALLGEKWVFKGGTCLKKCFVETWRFSEDLDFTVQPGGPVTPGEVVAALQPALIRARDASGIDFLARAPAVKPRAGGEAAEGSVYYRGARQTPGVARIRLDLSRIERIVLAPVRRQIHHAYPDALPEPGTVQCYEFEEVFAEKIRAMGERGRPRDLYDIVNLFRHSELRETGPRVMDVLRQKCGRKGLPVPTLALLEGANTRAELESEWESMLGHQLPALPPLESFWSELPALFSWLEGKTVAEVLVPAPSLAGEEAGWTAPALLQTWGLQAPLEAIRFAAANRLCVDLHYDGEWRVIEPYSLRRTREGNLVLHAARADSGQHRSYRVDRIEGARLTQRVFQPRYLVELSAVGPISAPPTARKAQWQATTRPVTRYEVECPVCSRVFPRTTADRSLRPHKGRDGIRCPGRSGILRPSAGW